MAKKIYCIFSAQYLPHLGGVERYTYNLAKTLTQKGNKVVVVTSQIDDLPEKEISDGILIYRLPCINLLNGRYPVLKFWKKQCSIVAKKLKKQDISLVVINTRFYLHSLFAARFAKKAGIKSIIIDHGTSHLSVHNKFFDTIGAWWEHIITAMDKYYCKDYYGVSLATCEWLKHFHIKPKGALYNALNMDDINDYINDRDKEFREKHNIPKDAKVIAFTGRLLEEKGIKQLVSSVERISKDRDDVYLLLAGDGDLEEYVDQRKSEHIIPMGRLEYQDVISMLCESDIFCMPSFSEGFSTSILEAAACKCYIITTERGGSKELVVSNEYGTIIPTNDEELVYNAIVQVLDDDEFRKEACEKSYQKLISEFIWDVTADKIINISDTDQYNS